MHPWKNIGPKKNKNYRLIRTPPPSDLCIIAFRGEQAVSPILWILSSQTNTVVVFQYQAIFKQIQSNTVFNTEPNTTVLNTDLVPQMIADLSIFISLKGNCLIFGCFCRWISKVKVLTWVNISDGAGTCLVCTVAVNDTASAVIYASTITYQLTCTDQHVTRNHNSYKMISACWVLK